MYSVEFCCGVCLTLSAVFGGATDPPNALGPMANLDPEYGIYELLTTTPTRDYTEPMWTWYELLLERDALDTHFGMPSRLEWLLRDGRCLLVLEHRPQVITETLLKNLLNLVALQRADQDPLAITVCQCASVGFFAAMEAFEAAYQGPRDLTLWRQITGPLISSWRQGQWAPNLDTIVQRHFRLCTDLGPWDEGIPGASERFLQLGGRLLPVGLDERENVSMDPTTATASPPQWLLDLDDWNSRNELPIISQGRCRQVLRYRPDLILRYFRTSDTLNGPDRRLLMACDWNDLARVFLREADRGGDGANSLRQYVESLNLATWNPRQNMPIQFMFIWSRHCMQLLYGSPERGMVSMAEGSFALGYLLDGPCFRHSSRLSALLWLRLLQHPQTVASTTSYRNQIPFDAYDLDNRRSCGILDESPEMRFTIANWLEHECDDPNVTALFQRLGYFEHLPANVSPNEPVLDVPSDLLNQATLELSLPAVPPPNNFNQEQLESGPKTSRSPATLTMVMVVVIIAIVLGLASFGLYYKFVIRKRRLALRV
jgi:hypothetical protein